MVVHIVGTVICKFMFLLGFWMILRDNNVHLATIPVLIIIVLSIFEAFGMVMMRKENQGVIASSDELIKAISNHSKSDEELVNLLFDGLARLESVQKAIEMQVSSLNHSINVSESGSVSRETPP